MKMKMYAFFSILLVLVMCIGMAACSADYAAENPSNRQSPVAEPSRQETVPNQTVENVPVDYEKQDYTLVSENGEHYIVFEDADKYENFQCQEAAISFPSMQTFKDSVINGTLSSSKKATMTKVFRKNEDGSVPACDFDNMYVPVVPGEYFVEGVGWEGGEAYGFIVYFTDDTSASIQYLSADRYEEIYQSKYVNYFDNDNITVTKTEITEDGKEIIRYRSKVASFRAVRYSVTEGDKTVIVEKTYRDSQSSPYKLKLYGTQGQQHYVVTIMQMRHDPTDEWIMSFGLEKFAGTNDIDRFPNFYEE